MLIYLKTSIKTFRKIVVDGDTNFAKVSSMKRFRFYHIQWDTDGVPPKKLNLPHEFEYETNDPEFDVENEGADVLSDEFGYCVKSFEFEQL